MQDLNKIGKLELDLDQAEAVTGGEITNSQKSTLNNVLLQAKGSGKSLDDVLGMIPGYYNTLHMLYPNITLEEVQSYVTDVWDTL